LCATSNFSTDNTEPPTASAAFRRARPAIGSLF